MPDFEAAFWVLAACGLVLAIAFFGIGLWLGWLAALVVIALVVLRATEPS